MTNFKKIVNRILSETNRNPSGRHYCGVLVGSELVSCSMNNPANHAEVDALKKCIQKGPQCFELTEAHHDYSDSAK